MTKEQNNEEITIPAKFQDLIEKIESLNKGRLSLGGGSQGSSGDSSEEIESLQKRYPKLSRDQIISRLSEIRSLYPKK